MTSLVRGGTDSRLSRAAIDGMVVAAILGLWSVVAYLVIRVDADIVAEAIQVQRWLREPWLVVSYPGQLYGGVLEYPIIALQELVLPGNVYALTFPRIFYLPVVGFLTVLTTRRLFPDWKTWPFIVVVAAGPAVLHSMMAIKDLYPFSLLLAALSVFILAREWDTRRRTWVIAVGGLLGGLAVYEHPTAALLVIPLVVLATARLRIGSRDVVAASLGFAIGLIPLLFARFGQSGVYVSYQPSRPGSPNVQGALGLNLGTDAWPTAMVPNGWGVQYTNLNAWAFPPGLQFAINVAIVVFLAACIAVVVKSARQLRWASSASPVVALSALWSALLIVVVAITLVVPPVFFYGAALAVPVWITLVGGMNVVAGRTGFVLAWIVVALAAVTSLGSVLGWNPALPGAVGFKRAQVEIVEGVAQAIDAEGIDVVFGDYWEVLPIAYASKGRLSAVTVPTSRFEPPAKKGNESTRVAVATGYTVLPPGLERWPSAEQAVGFVDAQCVRLPRDVAGIETPIRIYECPDGVFLD